MEKRNKEFEKGINRRNLLKLTGAATVAGVGVSAIGGTVSAEDTPEAGRVTSVDGRTKREYIEKATGDIRSREEYADFRARLSERGYKVDTGDALVTKKVGTDGEETTTVFLPLTRTGTTASLGDFSPIFESYSDAGAIEFGHVVWNDNPSSDVFAIVTGDAKTVTAGINLVSDETVATMTSGIEVINLDNHHIELSTEVEEASTAVIKESSVSAVLIDMNEQAVREVSSAELKATDVTSCPSSIPTILAALGGCGAFCSGCASLSIGNPTAIFACIGCAGCGCGLGCCLGERSSTLCSAASSYLALPSFIRGPGPTAGAICVREGCNDKTCF